ncbi:MAG: adenosine deaminase [Lachnospiraceae bacterium]|nr:adenosine deaminase [Lachnospiraceae bacterium]
MISSEFIKGMPKIDLHCHLDGSLPLPTAKRILKDLGEEWDEERLFEEMGVPDDCPSLAAYLACFDLPIRCLQTADALEMCARDMAVKAAEENTVYLEARFAPSTQLLGGLSVREAIEAVDRGLKRAERETGIMTGIIVCAMRHLPEETNLAMFRQAREMLGAGVSACDLAGDEASFPMHGFRTLFEEAVRLGLPFTVHAGECGSRANIREAIDLGALRIGHGTAASGDPALLELAADRGVGFEQCPTSNVQTKILPGFAGSPVREFMQAGVPVSIGTDNRTVSRVDLTEEFSKLSAFAGLTREEAEKIYFDSMSMAFAGDGVKERLFWKGRDFFGPSAPGRESGL